MVGMWWWRPLADRGRHSRRWRLQGKKVGAYLSVTSPLTGSLSPPPRGPQASIN